MRIIYLDIDSIRPDHMGCYGYERDTTPNIDRIASEGTRFNDCYCASSPCVPSRASFMSGRFAVNHGAFTHWGPGYDFYYPEGDGHSETMPFFTRHLRKAAYKTVTFSTFGDRHHAWWYFAGWNEVHTHSLKEGNEDADEVNAAVIPWLKQHGKEENYFLHIQYWDPHTMYTYPKEYADMWKDSPVKTFPNEETIQEHRRDIFPRSASFLHTANEIPAIMPKQITSRSDFQQLLDGYDGGISYMDRHVGQLLETLRELGIEDEVCFIISADHGESMGEQGIYMEHATATEAVHHIPLIIKVPGVTKPGTVIDGFVYNVDVIATITDLLRLEVPSGWDGTSFLPALKGEHWQGRDYLVMDHGLYTCQRAVRDAKWYYIRTYHPGLYRFDVVTLYDMENDPNQLINVADIHPDVVKEMDHRLTEWTQQNLAQPGHRVDPMQKVIETGPWKYVTLEGWVQRLRNEGWDEAADQLLNKYQA
ncbi:sulfatase [Paenibacillus radicis (ex Xue et al. 2023)]|uniref:Sulfatase-like hydrolase/transferase n=1 Tax=Paenibacillus radicis (ex Xue et al. 2023) TaxID=2972489 RepID=A0ABT1YJ34_9BACL|nr:sulfatase [Paenibacillus radicis (ex Xue et al. 2023)]MCR8633188.1 sulfatase-like hydrolase/transferase [Paenibacillus radicis (ex Xue et al. 2023)]